MERTAATMETEGEEERRRPIRNLLPRRFASQRCNYGTLMFNGVPRASLHSRGNSWFDADIGEGEGERVVGQCRRIKRDRIEERTIPFLGLNRILKFVKCPWTGYAPFNAGEGRLEDEDPWNEDEIVLKEREMISFLLLLFFNFSFRFVIEKKWFGEGWMIDILI